MFSDDILSSNLGFFILINLNIIVVMVLGFLVIKNIVKLLLDRRRDILGAKLKSRLVAAFVGLSLVPTILLFLVAKGILASVLEGWFSPQIATSVDSALAVAKYQYDETEALVTRQARHLSQRLSVLYPILATTGEPIKSGVGEKNEPFVVHPSVHKYLKRKLGEYGLSEIVLIDREGTVFVREIPTEGKENSSAFPAPDFEAIQKALHGSFLIRSEQFGSTEILRIYLPVTADALSLPKNFTGEQKALRATYLRALTPRTTIPSLDQPPSGDENNQEVGRDQKNIASRYCLVTTLSISPELSAILAKMIDAYDDYKELGIYRRPLVSSYILALVVVTLMIVFAAVWVGFFLAKTLTEPIQLLADGTRQVAHGNLDYRIPEVGDDELSILVRSFNKMTEDLKDTTDELISRRRHMETVLASVEVGVISIDRQGHIATFNVAAANMTGVQTSIARQLREEPQGGSLENILPTALSQRIDEMLEDLYQSSENLIHSNLSLSISGESKHLQITMSKLADENAKVIGAVILLDDLTALVSAQRMAAWREVARRIAHEIKNPLTPIQLCAQRIQRRLNGEDVDGEHLLPESTRQVVSTSADIIIKQVETLRTLVNEFSAFARMPKALPKPVDLNALLLETGSMYREAHPEIMFWFDLDSHTPVTNLDPEQLSRVFINLLDNAVQSIIIAWQCGPAWNLSEAMDKTFSITGIDAKDIALDREAQDEQFPSFEQTVKKSLGESGILGTIVIRSFFEESLGLISVEVSDSGTGIADRDKPKLFEPYFSRKKEGSGLGLAIASAIIADHHGFMRVRDNQPRGATFIIELPVEQSQLVRQA